MMAVMTRMWRDRWRMFAAVTGIGLMTMLMYVSLFPTYQKTLAQSGQIYRQLPEALKKAFNIQSFSFDTLEKFLNIEMYSLFWIILTLVLVISLAKSSLAGAIEHETIVQTLAQPVSRRTAYLGKFLMAAKIFTVFNLIVNASVFPLATTFHLTIQPSHFVIVTVMCELFGLALLGLGFSVSSWMSEEGRVNMTLSGIILIMYVLNIVSGIQPKIDGLKYASLFHYFNPYQFLVNGQYDPTAIVVFSGLTIVGFAIGLWRFTTRDVS